MIKYSLALEEGNVSFDQGGVHLTKDPSVVAGLCNAMIGNKLITKQTPPEGIPVSKVVEICCLVVFFNL